jgi:hypothetical protein
LRFLIEAILSKQYISHNGNNASRKKAEFFKKKMKKVEEKLLARVVKSSLIQLWIHNKNVLNFLKAHTSIC